MVCSARRERKELTCLPSPPALPPSHRHTVAAEHGHAECVAALLASEAGVDANHATTAHGSTALTLAAQNGHTACVEALLAVPGIDANHATAAHGTTALVLACQDGHTACVAALLAAPGIDVNQTSLTGDSPLILAAQGGHAACVEALLAVDGIDHSHATPDDGCTALILAAQGGHAACVGALLAVPGIDAAHATHEHGWTALILAAQNGHASCVEALLAVAGIDANQALTSTGTTALIVAAQNGHVACVHALLGAGGIGAGSVGLVGGAALALGGAALASGWQLGRYTNGAAATSPATGAMDSDADAGNDAAGAGAGARGPACVRRLVACRLILAAQFGHALCVQALLGAGGVDVNHTTNQGDTALTCAVINSHAECVRRLVAVRGIRVNYRYPSDGRTSLHDACSAGAHPTASSPAAHTTEDIVATLLVSGGCRFAVDDDGNTPMDLADGNPGVLGVFFSGVDYWQRKHHARHGWAMKEALLALMLVRQRLAGAGQQGARAGGPPALALPHMPEEIWLLACGYLRGADFMH